MSHACNPGYLRRQRKEDHEFKASLGKVSETLSKKQNTNKKVLEYSSK
jgi:hypothetical protein